MERLHRNRNMLATLAESDPKLRKLILMNCSPDVIKTLTEIAFNAVRGNIKLLTPEIISELGKHKHTLRKLSRCIYCSSKSNSGRHHADTKKARNILSQRGGFFPLIPLLTMLAPIAAKAAVGGLIASGVGAVVKKVTGT